MEFGRGPTLPGLSSQTPPGGTLLTPQRHRTRSGGISSTTYTPSLHSPGSSSVHNSDFLSGRISRVFNCLPVSSKFSLVDQIGEGTFSTVYLATKQGGDTESNMAIKHLVPTSKPARIAMEVRCMKESGTHPNVISLLGIWRTGGDVLIGMPYVDHIKFMDLVASVELDEVRLYMANLLSAVGHIHSLGIIHRDIKPSNFLYDRKRKKFALVDFGLAQWEESSGIKGNKRRHSDVDQVGDNKRIRLPLGELNCSPQSRVITDLRVGGEVRRSPRKVVTPDQEQELISLNKDQDNNTPKQRLNFGPPGRMAISTRSSPRKTGLPQGRVSKLTIQNSLLQTESTPSPSLSRTNSFTLLEPSCLSQATDYRTPLLRASITSHCSSTLPRPELGGSIRPPASSNRSSTGHTCSCKGHLQICDMCKGLLHLHAARAGTPGFRPPEVLLKYQTQTVAVDMWAVGVILLSLLSRSYPFFRSPDDMTAIAELCTLFGTKEVVTSANRYGRMLSVSQEMEGEDLATVCTRLSGRGENSSLVTKETIGLLKLFLQLDYTTRISAKEALSHPLLVGVCDL